MDLRPAIRNLISVVSNFITEPKLKAQLDQLYMLTIKLDTNMEDIERQMINLGKNNKTHHRINSQPIVLTSPIHNKVQLMSGVNVPAFSGGISTKAISFGSRIQYVTPNREKEEKQKNKSDRQISFKFETTKPSTNIITEFKLIDKQNVDINQKIKLYSEMPQSYNVVPVLQSDLETYSQNKITLKSVPIKYDNCSQKYEEELIEKQYDQSKISGRMLHHINQNMKEMKINTFKLIKVFENTHEIKTQSSLLNCSQLDTSFNSPFRKQQNPLFNGIRGKITDQDLNNIQQNFLMKKLIVKAKQNEQIEFEIPNMNIFYVTSVQG